MGDAGIIRNLTEICRNISFGLGGYEDFLNSLDRSLPINGSRSPISTKAESPDPAKGSFSVTVSARAEILCFNRVALRPITVQ